MAIEINQTKRRISWGKFLLVVSAIILVALLYLVGVVVANDRAKPFKEALSIVNEAEGSVKEQMLAVSGKDPDKELEFERKYVSLYAKAAAINLDDYPILKGYIKETYQLSNDVLAYDEKLLSGHLKMTEEESKKLVDGFQAKRKDVLDRYWSYARIETWMKLFLVNIP